MITTRMWHPIPFLVVSTSLERSKPWAKTHETALILRLVVAESERRDVAAVVEHLECD